MNRSMMDVLSEKKGMALELGVVVMVMAMLLAAGAVITNFGILSRQAAELQALNQEVTNRAERFVSDLNEDLTSTVTPSSARQCSTFPAMCTQIIGFTPSGDGARIVLRIQADSVSKVGQTVTKDVTILSEEVTHVTAIDDTGKQTWALSDEGLRFKVWSLAEGKPAAVKTGDLSGPAADNRWVSVDDRAGIDSKGALWLWGKNNIGQAGVGSTSTQPVMPQRFAAEGTSFRFVVTDDDRGYAIDAKGNLWAWGKNTKGQLGLGHANNVLSPTKVPAVQVTSLAVGQDNAVALTTSGELLTAGAAQRGYSIPAGSTFIPLEPGATYKAVASSSVNGGVAVIRSDGRLIVNGSTSVAPASVKFSAVSRGARAGYAISVEGDLYAWGDGAFGQLGLGADNVKPSSATKVMPGTKFIDVQGNETSAFAIDTRGGLYYFGKSPSGYVGGIDLPQVFVPTKLLPDVQFRSVAANNGDTVVSLLDMKGNIYSLGTATPGLWATNYQGSSDQPIRMPLPDGFSSNTWK
ncbi:Regulator of chromosome condensation (RCC1) repeat-containing protein [Plantibacter flavus]|uniref:Regulator of chromosome condensation (RCC1) repeat-containing protein n=1 Tax=Plantibacter flavus TaxID=150123 RepID=A0A3N2BLK2_9MICO|nr:hypothetical protein [Plantibacter flavus]ROR76116.1 regulator of chromosome condensation (RCC1) repeat-containing protein [Plantibacter flavus]SMG48436.1 Regulator of chromosome condensation (RCC1) repeat-containing protein [Plantibacter flavus]